MDNKLAHTEAKSPNVYIRVYMFSVARTPLYKYSPEYNVSLLYTIQLEIY